MRDINYIGTFIVSRNITLALYVSRMLYYLRHVSLKILYEVETLGLQRLTRETFGYLAVSLAPLSFTCSDYSI